MKATIESTDQIVAIGRADETRVWEGITEGGIEFVAYISLLQVRRDKDCAEFDRALREHKQPSDTTRRAVQFIQRAAAAGEGSDDVLGTRLDPPERRAARTLADTICPLLTARAPLIHGIVLADLIARYLAHIVVDDDFNATQLARVKALHGMLNAVRGFVERADEENSAAGHA